MSCTTAAAAASAALAVLALVVPASAHVPAIDGHTKYYGRGTYYGTPPMPPNTHVHCHLPNTDKASGYSGWRTIAMNKPQYDGSRACGMCVEVRGEGHRCEHGIDKNDGSCGLGGDPISGTFKAVVTDELWERGWGDIDLGWHGDGHWPVNWTPIPCPWDKRNARMALHAGANRNYMKVQMRYLDSPMKWMKMENTGEVSNYRFHDNFFVFQTQGNGYQFNEQNQIYFRVESMLGTHYCGSIDSNFRAEPYEYMAWPC